MHAPVAVSLPMMNFGFLDIQDTRWTDLGTSIEW